MHVCWPGCFAATKALLNGPDYIFVTGEGNWPPNQLYFNIAAPKQYPLATADACTWNSKARRASCVPSVAAQALNYALSLSCYSHAHVEGALQRALSAAAGALKHAAAATEDDSFNPVVVPPSVQACVEVKLAQQQISSKENMSEPAKPKRMPSSLVGTLSAQLAWQQLF